MDTDGPRLDKWLWAVRIFKTRSLATEACKKGRVRIKQQVGKPAREVKVGDLIEVRKDNIFFCYEVKQVLGKRIGAKLVKDYLIDRTTPEQLEALAMQQLHKQNNRNKGLGRPTKKERRDLEDLFAPD